MQNTGLTNGKVRNYDMESVCERKGQ